MGAWDVTAFCNDDASDWASEFVDEGNPVEFLERTFALARSDGYLEAPDGCQVVAAAAVIAAARSGNAPESFPDAVRQWLRGKERSLKRLAAPAEAAVQRVKGADSELRELWEETEDFAAWDKELETISAALGRQRR